MSISPRSRVIFLVGCLCGLSMVPASGQTQRLYDQHGNYRGQLSQEGSRLVVRDANGNAKGYYTQEGTRTVFHDKYGNPRGSMCCRE